jgi:hypothetical protein
MRVNIDGSAVGLCGRLWLFDGGEGWGWGCGGQRAGGVCVEEGAWTKMESDRGAIHDEK